MRAILPLVRRAAAVAARQHPNQSLHHVKPGTLTTQWRAFCAAPAAKTNTQARAEAHVKPTRVAQDGGTTEEAGTEIETEAGAASADAARSPCGLTTEDIYQLSANRATRYVYLRTIPLAKQDALTAADVTSLASAIEAGARVVIQRHLRRVVDERAAVHLHTTALAVATQRALTGIRLCATSSSSPDAGAERVENVVRAGFGAKLVHDPSLTEEENLLNAGDEGRMRPDFWIIRAALWFAFDKMGAVAKMTENMTRDFGDSFETKSEDTTVNGVRKNVVTVHKCLYDQVCRAEGMPQLTHVFCALDRAMYTPLNRSKVGIQFDLERTLADDEHDGKGRRCEFKFVQEE